jgi:hypothetical protein
MSRPRRLFALVLALTSALPALSAAQDVPSYSPAELKLLRGVIELPFDRRQSVLKKLGVTPSDGFLNCLCIQARYGSSTTRQRWHPDTLGEYNPRYSCQQPGLPCVVEGFGCSRHPAPTSQKIWESCAKSYASDDGKTVIDSVLEAAKARDNAKSRDLNKKLKECRAHYEVGRGQPPDPFAGLDYLKAKGVPLLPPPPHLMKKMQTAAQAAQRRQAEQLRALQIKARTEATKSLSEKLQDKIFTDKNKKAALANTAKLGMAYVQSEIEDLRKHRDQVGQTLKQLQSLPMSPENDAKIDKLKSVQWKLNSQQRQLDRDKSHLEQFAGALDAGADIVSLQGIYDDATSGDNRKFAGSVVKSAEMAKKYYDKFTKASIAAQEQILNAVRNNLTGADPADFASAARKAELLKGMSDVMGETIKAANWSMKAYDGLKKFEKAMAQVDEYAASGRYTKAQAGMLNAFAAMSALSGEAAAYLPPGVSDMMSFYSEAMKTPAVFDGMIREFVNSKDDGAQITGDQANTPAMKAFQKRYGDLKFLMRDQYLFRGAGLSAYEIDNPSDKNKYMFISDPASDPIYVSEANYRKVSEFAYYFPIVHGRRMTDADLLEQFGSMGENSSVNLDDMKRQVKEALERAAQDHEAARMFGQKTVTRDEYRLWSQFGRDIRSRLPRKCQLDKGMMKRLFGAYRDEGSRENVLAKIEKYGDALKSVDPTAQKDTD